uniref:L-rhamnose mutarotase n=1 Tax=Haptolina ericina TaxID=156174 RepID=A0A7S3BWZ6_9EUKA
MADVKGLSDFLACPAQQHMTRKRVLFRLRCKEGQEEEYRRRHRNVWPVVEADLARAGVDSMNVWMDGRDILLMMEMAPGTSFAEATRYLDASAESVRWEAFMEEIMEGVDGTDYDPNNAYPEDGLEQVYVYSRPVWTCRHRHSLMAMTLGVAAAGFLIAAVKGSHRG